MKQSTRSCAECKQQLPASEYYGANYKRCKKCHTAIIKAARDKRKDYYLDYWNNYKKENKQKIKEYSRQYYLHHRQESSEYGKIYNANLTPEQQERKKQQAKLYREKNRPKRNRYMKKKYAQDESYREKVKEKNLRHYHITMCLKKFFELPAEDQKIVLEKINSTKKK